MVPGRKPVVLLLLSLLSCSLYQLHRTLQPCIAVCFLLSLRAAAGGSASSFWGTLEYVAPEVAMNGAGAYSPASDWWGLGVLMYELLLGLVPWDGEDYDTILEQIKMGDVLWPPEGIVSIPLCTQVT